MMKPTNEQLAELLRLIAATRPEEIDCDELLARVGALLETLERGEAPPPELATVQQHLDVCSECREEFDALLKLHGADH